MNKKYFIPISVVNTILLYDNIFKQKSGDVLVM